jgi:hypothetical protein
MNDLRKAAEKLKLAQLNLKQRLLKFAKLVAEIEREACAACVVRKK